MKQISKHISNYSKHGLSDIEKKEFIIQFKNINVKQMCNQLTNMEFGLLGLILSQYFKEFDSEILEIICILAKIQRAEYFCTGLHIMLTKQELNSQTGFKIMLYSSLPLIDYEVEILFEPQLSHMLNIILKPINEANYFKYQAFILKYIQTNYQVQILNIIHNPSTIRFHLQQSAKKFVEFFCSDLKYVVTRAQTSSTFDPCIYQVTIDQSQYYIQFIQQKFCLKQLAECFETRMQLLCEQIEEDKILCFKCLANTRYHEMVLNIIIEQCDDQQMQIYACRSVQIQNNQLINSFHMQQLSNIQQKLQGDIFYKSLCQLIMLEPETVTDLHNSHALSELIKYLIKNATLKSYNSQIDSIFQIIAQKQPQDLLIGLLERLQYETSMDQIPFYIRILDGFTQEPIVISQQLNNSVLNIIQQICISSYVNDQVFRQQICTFIYQLKIICDINIYQTLINSQNIELIDEVILHSFNQVQQEIDNYVLPDKDNIRLLDLVYIQLLIAKKFDSFQLLTIQDIIDKTISNQQYITLIIHIIQVYCTKQTKYIVCDLCSISMSECRQKSVQQLFEKQLQLLSDEQIIELCFINDQLALPLLVPQRLLIIALNKCDSYSDMNTLINRNNYGLIDIEQIHQSKLYDYLSIISQFTTLNQDLLKVFSGKYKVANLELKDLQNITLMVNNQFLGVEIQFSQGNLELENKLFDITVSENIVSIQYLNHQYHFDCTEIIADTNVIKFIYSNQPKHSGFYLQLNQAHALIKTSFSDQQHVQADLNVKISGYGTVFKINSYYSNELQYLQQFSNYEINHNSLHTDYPNVLKLGKIITNMTDIIQQNQVQIDETINSKLSTQYQSNDKYVDLNLVTVKKLECETKSHSLSFVRNGFENLFINENTTIQSRDLVYNQNYQRKPLNFDIDSLLSYFKDNINSISPNIAESMISTMISQGLSEQLSNLENILSIAPTNIQEVCVTKLLFNGFNINIQNYNNFVFQNLGLSFHYKAYLFRNILQYKYADEQSQNIQFIMTLEQQDYYYLLVELHDLITTENIQNTLLYKYNTVQKYYRAITHNQELDQNTFGIQNINEKFQQFIENFDLQYLADLSHVILKYPCKVENALQFIVICNILIYITKNQWQIKNIIAHNLEQLITLMSNDQTFKKHAYWLANNVISVYNYKQVQIFNFEETPRELSLQDKAAFQEYHLLVFQQLQFMKYIDTKQHDIIMQLCLGIPASQYQGCYDKITKCQLLMPQFSFSQQITVSDFQHIKTNLKDSLIKINHEQFIITLSPYNVPDINTAFVNYKLLYFYNNHVEQQLLNAILYSSLDFINKQNTLEDFQSALNTILFIYKLKYQGFEHKLLNRLCFKILDTDCYDESLDDQLLKYKVINYSTEEIDYLIEQIYESVVYNMIKRQNNHVLFYNLVRLLYRHQTDKSCQIYQKLLLQCAFNDDQEQMQTILEIDYRTRLFCQLIVNSKKFVEEKHNLNLQKLILNKNKIKGSQTVGLAAYIKLFMNIKQQDCGIVFKGNFECDEYITHYINQVINNMDSDISKLTNSIDDMKIIVKQSGIKVVVTDIVRGQLENQWLEEFKLNNGL
ncbi:Hypothetical_protein [Hexamita inflata]|uniref:Hypothetical_protein n=1 Tax=Hexamita inflata TaxID=28002 RepID=A0AA86TUF0_9EUKA|nr:Hypothetical protein HINF_LOCUS15197 [Hexamita inflata]